MTAPTHIAFGVASALLSGVSGSTGLGLIAGGALLPDVDHPQSAIGRVFFFLSIPLNRFFGHRGLIHSLVLWLPVSIVGYIFFHPLMLVGVGAISHVLIDCANTSGVSLLYPVTEKKFVLFSQKYRISVGSREEFILFGVLGVLTWGTGYISSHGGIRALVQNFIGTYPVAVAQYKQAGTKQTYFSGTLRFSNGRIVEGTWLVVGIDGSGSSTAIYDAIAQKIVRVPTQAEFLRVRVKITDDKEWHLFRTHYPMKVQSGTVFFRVKERWHIAKEGDLVFGDVQYLDNVIFDERGDVKVSGGRGRPMPR